MRTLPLAALVAIALLCVPSSVEAQYTFQAAGVATLGTDVFRIGITRHPDAIGFPTFGVGIVVREPTPTNPFNARFVEERWFYVVDNFNTSPGPTVSTHYFAISADPSVDFALQGTQIGHTVTATGHYAGYQFVVTADVGL